MLLHTAARQITSYEALSRHFIVLGSKNTTDCSVISVSLVRTGEGQPNYTISVVKLL